jgi:hypothetical protein
MRLKLNPSQYFSCIRLLFGLWLVQHFLLLFPIADELYGQEGMKVAGASLYLKGTLAFARTPLAIKTLCLFAIFLSLCFTLKIFRRTASALLGLIWVFFFHQNLLTYNPLLPFIGWLLFAQAMVPATEVRFPWEREKEPFNYPPVLFKGLWLITILGYVSGGLHKWMDSSLWQNGHALDYIYRYYQAVRFDFIANSFLSLPELTRRLINWTVLFIDIFFITGFFNKRLRLFFWFMTTLMHVGILLTLKFGEISIGMIIVHFFLVEKDWFSFGGLATFHDSILQPSQEFSSNRV